MILFGSGLFAEMITINPSESRSFTLNVLESNGDYTVVEVLLNNYFRHMVNIEGEDYYVLTVPSAGLRLEEGNPELPLIARNLMIPPQARMSVEVLDKRYTEFEGRVVPSKGVLYRSVNPADVPITYTDVYRTDAFFPANIIELGDPYILREIRGIPFLVSPFSFNPIQGTIRVHERMVFRVYADGVCTIDTMATRSSRFTRDFVSMYNSHFINFAKENTRTPTIEEKGSMLVIAHPPFVEATMPFVEWKRQKGIPTEIVTTNETGRTHESIRTFIDDYWTENPSLAFVQLVGAFAQIPAILLSVDGGPSASDNHYVTLRGSNWFPDLFIGRFSATTIEHVETQVLRSIWYERDLREGEWLNRAMGLAGNESGGHKGERDYDHMEIIRLLLLTYNYTQVDQFYQTMNKHSVPAPTVASVSAAFNEGRGFMNYISHGLENGWHFSRQHGSPLSYTSSEVNNLTNDWRLPHIVSVACLPGRFNSNNTPVFAEVWMRAMNRTTGAPRGAIAAWMSSMNQPWIPPMWAQDYVAELLVDEEYLTIGGLYFNAANLMLSHGTTNSTFINTLRTWVIFGDASLMVRSRSPLAMNVEAPAVLVIGATEYSFGIDVTNALASLFDPETQTILGTTVSNENGFGTIELASPQTVPTTLLLTVTAFNRITHVQEVKVIAPEGPFILFNSMSFPEGQGPIYGTTTGVNLTVYNVGVDTGTNLKLTLSSNNTYVNILQSEAIITSIAANAHYEILNTFSFEVAFNVPDMHIAIFTLIATDGEEEWIMEFPVSLRAPTMRIGSLSIVEIIGNGNNRLDPGETVEIHIPLINEGRAKSLSGNMVMMTNHSQVTVHNFSTAITETESGEQSYAVFKISTDEDMEKGSIVNFGVFADFTTQILQTNISLPVGVEVEDFESGDLSNFNWNLSGAAHWSITTDNVFEGKYSLVSGQISHNQTSTVTVSRVVESPGILSFWYKISSQQGIDRLNFRMNNVLLGEWSGEEDWTYIEYSIPSGTHSFQWVYRKGASGSAGLDSAWIDYIVFPITGTTEANGGILHTFTEEIDFSDAELNMPSIHEVVIANLGDIRINGTIQTPSGFTTDTTFSIPPNSNITINVSFEATEKIDYSGDLIIISEIDEIDDIIIPLLADLSDVSSIEVPEFITHVFGNFPNPFNPETAIRFSISRNQNIEISVYNIRGQLVKNLVNRTFEMGVHDVLWTGIDNNHRPVSSGVYFYRLSTPEKVHVGRMLLLK